MFLMLHQEALTQHSNRTRFKHQIRIDALRIPLLSKNVITLDAPDVWEELPPSVFSLINTWRAVTAYISF